ncbi:MAG: STAS domain-containing protein [Pirellulaceae bacterium]
MNRNGIFRVEHLGSTAVVMPLRDPDELVFDETQESEVASLLVRIAEGQTDNVIMDCERIDRCCSSAIGFFLKIAKRIREKGGQILFCNVSVHLKEVFDMLRLEKVFGICDTRDAAVAKIET